MHTICKLHPQNPNAETPTAAQLTSPGWAKKNITVDSTHNPYSPPWNRLPYDQLNGKCDENKPSGVLANFWSGIFPNFCADLNANGAENKFERHYTPRDFQTPANPPGGGPPPVRGENPDKWNQTWDIGFTFGGTNGGLCKWNCSQAYNLVGTMACKCPLPSGRLDQRN